MWVTEMKYNSHQRYGRPEDQGVEFRGVTNHSILPQIWGLRRSQKPWYWLQSLTSWSDLPEPAMSQEYPVRMVGENGITFIWKQGSCQLFWIRIKEICVLLVLIFYEICSLWNYQKYFHQPQGILSIVNNMKWRNCSMRTPLKQNRFKAK